MTSTTSTSLSPLNGSSPVLREGDQAPAHDAFTRLLQRQPPDTAALWQEAKAYVNLRKGLLILDDTTLDKPYARRMDRVTYHWSGKHQGVVKGIALLWTAGQALIPCDFRVYDKPQGGKTKYTVVLFPLPQFGKATSHIPPSCANRRRQAGLCSISLKRP